ncbi:acyl carrier protein [Erwinia sp. E602]|nr:acyl carrier protein [Erwinia sp. E602]
MNKEQALSRVYGLIQQASGLPAEKIGQHDSLINDLALDSVELIDLLMQLEEYNIVIPESQVNSQLTADRLAAYFTNDL